MKPNFIPIFLIFSLVSNYNFAQDIKMCAYRDYLTEADIKKACGFSSYMSNQNAEKVVDDILSNVGLFRNFIIKECPDISNAVAATVKSSLGSFERYIIYDKAFAEELERQGYGNKHITLYDIRAELNHRYKDLRTPYRSPTLEERFNMLTKESEQTTC